jgi:hypothetical protein
MNWWIDLLTIYIHHSELHVITAPLLISTIYRSSQHPLSLFPVCFVFNSRSLATVSNSGDTSASRAHVVTVRRISCNWKLVDCQLNYSDISSQSPLQSSTQLPAFNWLGPRLATISHQPLSLLFTGWLSTDNWTDQLNCLQDNSSARTTLETSFFYCCALVLFRGNGLTELLLRNGLHNLVVLLLRVSKLLALPSNGRCLQSRRLAIGLYTTIFSRETLHDFFKYLRQTMDAMKLHQRSHLT